MLIRRDAYNVRNAIHIAEVYDSLGIRLAGFIPPVANQTDEWVVWGQVDHPIDEKVLDEIIAMPEPPTEINLAEAMANMLNRNQK